MDTTCSSSSSSAPKKKSTGATAEGLSSANPIVLSSDEDDCEVIKVVAASKKEKIGGPSSIPYNHPPPSAFPQSNHFWSALNELVSSFEKNESNKSHPIHRVVCYSTSTVVCFYDKYHKARNHLLLIPRPNSPLGNINSISDLIPSQHLDDLREFHSTSQAIASAVTYGNDNQSGRHHRMLFGYHAQPSLTPLHLHIISSDFDSDCIKNKKHINSFTNSKFFVSPDVLEGHMQERGDVKVVVDTERANRILNSTPFSCFRCGMISSNVPQWKQHNRVCNTRLTDDYGAQTNASSLLGFERISNAAGGESKSKKCKAQGDAKPSAAGKDIRKFFGSSDKGKNDGEGSLY